MRKTVSGRTITRIMFVFTQICCAVNLKGRDNARVGICPEFIQVWGHRRGQIEQERLTSQEIPTVP